MFISPQQVIVSLEKASSGIFAPDPASSDGTQPSNSTTPQEEARAVARPPHYRGRYLTFSLAVLSGVLSFLLGWDFVNNVYAQEWVNQNIGEVEIVAFAIIMGIILLPLAAIVIIDILVRDEDALKSEPDDGP